MSATVFYRTMEGKLVEQKCEAVEITGAAIILLLPSGDRVMLYNVPAIAHVEPEPNKGMKRYP